VRDDVGIEGEKSLISLFELIEEAAFLVDQNGEIIDVNERACSILGYERESLKTLSLDSIL